MFKYANIQHFKVNFIYEFAIVPKRTKRCKVINASA